MCIDHDHANSRIQTQRLSLDLYFLTIAKPV